MDRLERERKIEKILDDAGDALIGCCGPGEEEILRAGIEVIPDSMRLHMELFDALQGMRKIPESLEIFEEFVRNNPGDVKRIMYTAFYLFENGGETALPLVRALKEKLEGMELTPRQRKTLDGLAVENAAGVAGKSCHSEALYNHLEW